MRNVMKFAAVVLLFFMVSFKMSAQTTNPLRLGIGINAGGSVHNPSRFVLGGDLRLQQGFGNSVSGILTTGYTHFFKSDKAGEGFGFIPLKVGLKVFPAKNFYIDGEAGAGFGTKENQKTSFVYSPAIGVALGNGLDVSLKYESFTKYSPYAQQLAVRIAYGFKL